MVLFLAINFQRPLKTSGGRRVAMPTDLTLPSSILEKRQNKGTIMESSSTDAVAKIELYSSTDDDDDNEQKEKAETRESIRRRTRAKYYREKRAERTAEERANQNEERRKQRAELKKKSLNRADCYQEKRANRTPEQIAQDNERLRKRRAEKKATERERQKGVQKMMGSLGDSDDPEVKIEVESEAEDDGDSEKEGVKTKPAKRNRTEYARKRRANRTPEEIARDKERRKKLYASRMTDEQKKDLGRQQTPLTKKRNRTEYSRIRRAKRTPEQRARDNELRRERRLKKIAAGMPPSDRNRKPIIETPEEREKRLERKRILEREKRAKMTEEERYRYRMRNYLNKQAQIASLSKEEKEERLRKNSEYMKNYLKNLPPEKREVYLEKLRKNAKRNHTNKKGSTSVKFLEYLRNKTAQETPEERLKRLRRYKINAARKKLKEKLEEKGDLPPEIIEMELTALVEKMRSEPLPPISELDLSQYKPRPSGRKPKKKNRETFNSTDHSNSNSFLSLPQLFPSINAPREPQLPNISVRHFKSFSDENNSLVSKSFEEPVNSKPSSSISDGDQDDDHFTLDNDYDYEDIQHLPEEEPIPCSKEPCPHCDQTFSNLTALSCHISSDHPWKCPSCSETIISSSHLSQHFKTMHSSSHPEDEFNLNYLCMRCPWNIGDKINGFQNHADLLEHVKLSHASSYWPCPRCNLLLYSESRCNSHLSLCSFGGRFKGGAREDPCPTICQSCGKLFSSPHWYRNHFKKCGHDQVEDRSLICPNCSRSFSTYSKSFWIHFVKCSNIIPSVTIPDEEDPPPPPSKSTKNQSRNSQYGPIPCDQCGKTFAQKCTLDDHIRRDHEGEAHLCPDCGRNFQSAGKLWRHQATTHNRTDLQAPPGVEVLRCKYCQDFIMRGYEAHVKKKHPKSLKDFRETELPKVKMILEKARERNPKRPYKSRVAGNSYSCIVDNYCVAIPNQIIKRGKSTRLRIREAEKVKCAHCPMVLRRGCMKRHLRNRHPTVHQSLVFKESLTLNPGKITCPVCGQNFKSMDNYQSHYADQHAYNDIEEMFISKDLIRRKYPQSTNINKVNAFMCLICDLELPVEKYAARVHFLTSHYETMEEVCINHL